MGTMPPEWMQRWEVPARTATGWLQMGSAGATRRPYYFLIEMRRIGTTTVDVYARINGYNPYVAAGRYTAELHRVWDTAPVTMECGRVTAGTRKTWHSNYSGRNARTVAAFSYALLPEPCPPAPAGQIVVTPGPRDPRPAPVCPPEGYRRIEI
jgi:hypothetical protein